MNDSSAYKQNGSGLYVPRSRRYDRPIGIDLFAGCGGMSLGFHQAGFHMVAALEFDPTAAITYMMNLARPGVKIHFDTDERKRDFEKVLGKMMGVKVDKGGFMELDPGRELQEVKAVAGSGWISHTNEPGCQHVWVADIRNIKGSDILSAIGVGQGEVDVIAGGPPCQGFSNAGRRQVMDPRNSLVFEFARMVIEIQPKTMIFENVPGILSMVTPEGVPVVDAFCRVLEDGGFGGYDALKRSLLASSDSGAALRNKGKVDGADEADDEESGEGEQLELFA